MARVALLDVNVLVALFDADHVHHDLAHDWFADHRDGWATCPITEAGLVRVISNPRYHPDAMRVSQAIASLRKFTRTGGHQFWPDTVSLLDDDVCDAKLLRGHGQLTDAYLLCLATKKNGCLATFDRTIPLDAVKGARHSHLSVISGK